MNGLTRVEQAATHSIENKAVEQQKFVVSNRHLDQERGPGQNSHNSRFLFLRRSLLEVGVFAKVCGLGMTATMIADYRPAPAIQPQKAAREGVR